MEEKQVIRKQVFKFRKDATEEQIRMKSSQIVEKLLHMEEFISADKVLAYMDFNHEVMTRTFIEKCWELGKKVAVPKVNGKEMTFYDLTSFEQLEDGYYHIPEPAYGEAVYWEDGFMLVPGVAFDVHRHRIGYGQGFYDKYLSRYPQLYKTAVAFEFQIFKEVPFENTDILPDVLITEERILI